MKCSTCGWEFNRDCEDCQATYLEDNKRLPQPVRTADGNKENFTIRSSGKFFHCQCGCNVFHKPDDRDLELYECNACGIQFEGE
jgi:hypothetical protein